jgi:transposase
VWLQYVNIVAMYVETIPNRNSRPAILLREAWREGKQIRKRTLANLSSWPDEKIEALRRLLKDDNLIAAESAIVIERSIPHGHVEAVVTAIRKLGLDTLISSRRCPEADLVIAMIAERLLDPCSKLATTRLWHTTTLAEELGVAQADEDDLYAALDWLLARQPRIEKNLAGRHLTEGATVLYDVTSSYYEGHTCPLAKFGHNRDGKKGMPIIVYGMLADEKGRPIAIDVYPGNTGDPTTVPPQVEKFRKHFGLKHLVIVGDRGMLTQPQIEKLKEYPEIGWISALRSQAIRKLTQNKHIQMSIFDKKNLAEIHSPDFPGERLVACYNPALAEERSRKRTELLAATEKDLAKIVCEVARRTKTPLSKVEIAKKVGKVLNRFKMGKHFSLTIDDGVFSYARKDEAILRESQMDGLYVIRTSEPAEKVSAEDAVRGYKSLAQVERAFRCLKGVDLLVRPIHHRTENHVKAHIFLCMLAYYVEWYMRKALAPLLFEDEELEELRKTRDAVKPAQPSASSKRKKALKMTADGFATHSFQTLLSELGTLCRNKCRIGSDSNNPAFYQMTEPTPLQKRAFDLLDLYPVNGN